MLSDGFSYPEFRFSDISQDSKAEKHVIKFLCKSSMCTRKETFPVLVFQTIKVWWFDNCQEKFWLCFVWMTTFLRRLNNKWHKQVSQSLSFTYGKTKFSKIPSCGAKRRKTLGENFCIWNIFHFIFCEKKKYLHVWNNYFFLYNIFFNALIFFF